METCLSQRLTEEESPESRMREIRTSGLMRGGEQLTKPTTTVGSIRPSFSPPTLPEKYKETHMKKNLERKTQNSDSSALSPRSPRLRAKFLGAESLNERSSCEETRYCSIKCDKAGMCLASEKVKSSLLLNGNFEERERWVVPGWRFSALSPSPVF
jgi:hypothetical protein